MTDAPQQVQDKRPDDGGRRARNSMTAKLIRMAKSMREGSMPHAFEMDKGGNIVEQFTVGKHRAMHGIAPRG